MEYLSEEKIKELKKELTLLTGTRRKEIAANLEYAKSLGDLSENAEYHQAMEEHAKLEDRIRKLEDILRNATVTPNYHGSTVSVGSEVTLLKEKTEVVYHIVGSEEADMAKGLLSYQSPLGKNLLNKQKGDLVKLNTPKGEVVYKIIEVK